MPILRRSIRPALPLCIAVSLSGLAGCAGENARLVAQQTVKATIEYEQQVDRKIVAEKAFYAEQVATLSDALAGPPAASGEAGAAGLSKQTWLHGRIRVAANQDARETAGRILASHDGEVLALMSSYVARGMEANREALQEIARERMALAQQLDGTLKPLEKQKARLKALREGLTTLSAERDSAARLAELRAVAEVVIEELRKDKSAAKSP
ncbi:hypothetical protein STVA_35150 [Allostella vacuolata]|nr:hypothetical protein STVA_35150 [Stella vacuolata]